MQTLVPRIAGDIDARLRELAPVLAEYDQLVAVRDAMTTTDAAAAVPHRIVHPRARRAGQERRRPYAAGGKRAPRGENRRRIMRLLAKGPATLQELVRATGISTPTAATTLSQMKAKGLTHNAGGQWSLTPAAAREVTS